MDSGELIDLFYNRAYEKFVNKQILDDKNYIVPRQQLKNYVHELVDIPFVDFIDYIKQNGIERTVEVSDVTQFSSFSVCEIEMCNALIWANNPGCQYIDIGRLFPNNILSRSDSSYRRYGESHIKAAAQLGLTFEYYNYWYLSCLGYIFPELDESLRRRFLARTITRNRLYQQLLVDIMQHDVNPEVYIDILPVYMIRKSLRSVCTYFDICLETCREENIKTCSLIKSYERVQTPGTITLPPEANESLRNYLNSFEYRTLSFDTTKELIKKYKTGDRKAYDILTKGYLRLVVTIAKKYMHRGLELEDLIQEGTCGLFKAFDHFNANVNVGFSKYASWWIMQSITQALFTLSNIVQLPLNVLSLHRKVWEFVDNFEQTHGYPPSVEDIDIDDTSDLEWLNYIYQLPADLKEQTCLISDFDIYESPNSQTDFFQETEYNSYFINRQLRRLGIRKSTILRKYFGLEGNQEGETLSAIGDYFGLTRERVRQIVEKSIRELRELSGIKREEAKIGDLIRLDSSEKVGKVVNIRQAQDGSAILVLKMDAGNTEEVSASDSSYEILPKRIVKNKPAPSTPTPVAQAKERKQLELSKNTQDVPDTQREVKKLDDVKVGDILKYNGKECVIRKIICRGSSSRLLIEYTNGVLDYVPNDKSRYRIVHTLTIPQYQVKEERKSEIETRRQDDKEAAVGDRIVYNTKPCIVLEKSKKYNVVRLKVRYDDGRIDNVLGDHNKYEVLYRHSNNDKKELSQPVHQERIVREVVTPHRKAETTAARKSKEELYSHYTQLIMKLNQAVVHGKRILAKPALLVAVIDSVESKEIHQNRIVVTTNLEDKYNRILAKYTGKSIQDKLTSIAMPFWHLQSEKFWSLEPPYPNTKNFNPTKKWIIDNVKYASLDDDLWYLLRDSSWRNKLRKYIVGHKLLDDSVAQSKKEELVETEKQKTIEKKNQSQFFTTTSLTSLVGLGIITKKQLKHCHKKGLTTIGDVKKKIEYYKLTPDSTRFTKYTLDMWFLIVGLLNNNA